MKIFVLFAQRVCDYPGEYAPEALDCISSEDHADNPSYMRGKIDEYRRSKQFEALELVPVTVSSEALAKILSPEGRELQGTLGEPVREN